MISLLLSLSVGPTVELTEILDVLAKQTDTRIYSVATGDKFPREVLSAKGKDLLNTLGKQGYVLVRNAGYPEISALRTNFWPESAFRDRPLKPSPKDKVKAELPSDFRSFSIPMNLKKPDNSQIRFGEFFWSMEIISSGGTANDLVGTELLQSLLGAQEKDWTRRQELVPDPEIWRQRMTESLKRGYPAAAGGLTRTMLPELTADEIRSLLSNMTVGKRFPVAKKLNTKRFANRAVEYLVYGPAEATGTSVETREIIQERANFQNPQLAIRPNLTAVSLRFPPKPNGLTWDWVPVAVPNNWRAP
jgi:hypothetical protein